MAAVMAAGMAPPIALALATVLAPEAVHRPPSARTARPCWLLGASFITEGAIPFAAADPLRVIPSSMVGSAVTGGLSMAMEVAVAHRTAASSCSSPCTTSSATSSP